MFSLMAASLEMARKPLRRIASLATTITLPASLSEGERRALERAGNTCPVHESLHPEIDAPIEYRYE